MMRKPLTRAVAVTAVAVAAVLTGAGAAGAAARQPAKTPTTLSISEDTTSVSPGGKDVIHGVLLTGSKPAAKKTVHLDYYSHSAGKWVVLKTAATSGAGEAAFTVQPEVTTEYELFFAGTSTLASSHSGPATVLVVGKPTTLSVTEAAAVNTPDETDVLRGGLLAGSTPAAGETVRLYRFSQSAHKWYVLKTGRTSKAGEVAFTVEPQATSYYELVFAGSAHLAAAHSGVATIVVTKLPTTLSIKEAVTTIAAGQQDAISGVLQSGPSDVTRHVVYLYYYNSSTRKWVAASVQLTGGAGKVAFTVKPRTSTEYELVFKGTAGLYGADSSVATVTVTN